jgi:hypothetical protein
MSWGARAVGGVIAVMTVAVATGLAGCAGTTRTTEGQFASGNASGAYAVAGAAGTAETPSNIQLRLVAAPAQSAEVSWTMTCRESGGGVGKKSDQFTLQLPTIQSLPLPAPSDSCIVLANAQLHGSGTLEVSLYNGGAPPVPASTAGASSPSTSVKVRTASAPASATSNTTAATTNPSPCNSSHSAYFRCATAAAPYCEHGRCSYPAPSSGPCASGYKPVLVPTSNVYVCQQTSLPSSATGFVPTPQQVAKAKQEQALCQRSRPTVTLRQLEEEAATSEGIQC